MARTATVYAAVALAGLAGVAASLALVGGDISGSEGGASFDGCSRGRGDVFYEAAVLRNFYPHPDLVVVDRNGTLTWVHYRADRGDNGNLQVADGALSNVTAEEVRRTLARVDRPEDREEYAWNVTEAFRARPDAGWLGRLCSAVLGGQDDWQGRYDDEGCMDGSTWTLRVSTSKGVDGTRAYCRAQSHPDVEPVRSAQEGAVRDARIEAGADG